MFIPSLFGKIGSGEKAAIWCFSSILIAIPFSIFEKLIINI